MLHCLKIRSYISETCTNMDEAFLKFFMSLKSHYSSFTVHHNLKPCLSNNNLAAPRAWKWCVGALGSRRILKTLGVQGGGALFWAGRSGPGGWQLPWLQTWLHVPPCQPNPFGLGPANIPKQHRTWEEAHPPVAGSQAHIPQSSCGLQSWLSPSSSPSWL